jgi:putative ABC transport system permease protein
MELRPILSAMWRNRTGSVLIALQIALTLAIVVNCMFLAKNRIDFINRPSGMDVENIIYAQSIGFGMNYEHDATIDADLRLLRELPGVIAVSSTNQLPMSGSGNSNGFTAEYDDDAPRHSANTYTVNADAIDALGVTLASGRAFREEEIRRADHPNLNSMAPQVIITRELAEKLFEGEPAVGRLMYNGIGEAAEIVGVIEHMFGSWPSWEYAGQLALYPERTEGPMTRYIIRTQPGQRDALIPVIEKALADSNRTRIVRDVQAMRDRMDRTFEGENAVAITLTFAVVLLLLITGLGIVGLASFTVRQRTKQIGTRRAIGARKIDIIRYFLLENWLMTTIGIALGTALTIGVNYSLASAFDTERLNYWYLITGMLMLWVLGFLAVAEPARRASQVSPAIATRTV